METRSSPPAVAGCFFPSIIDVAVYEKLFEGRAVHRIKGFHFSPKYEDIVTALKKNMHYLKIPYLLQIFIESFGGYYIDSDADIGLISEITQIPKDQVVGCLEILNVFFPAENGWWIPTKNLRLLKFTPAFVRGIGSFMRKDQICERYSDLTSMGWLLSKYHDVAIDVIAMDEKLKQ